MKNEYRGGAYVIVSRREVTISIPDGEGTADERLAFVEAVERTLDGVIEAAIDGVIDAAKAANVPLANTADVIVSEVVG